MKSEEAVEEINDDNDKSEVTKPIFYRYHETEKSHYDYFAIWLSLSEEQKEFMKWVWSSASIKRLTTYDIARPLNEMGFIAAVNGNVFNTFEGDYLRMTYNIAESRKARKDAKVLEKDSTGETAESETIISHDGV